MLMLMLMLMYQSKVGGCNHPVDGEGGEEDEGSQQGQAEVEAACSQARTAHNQVQNISI